jgi:hypothetical protein
MNFVVAPFEKERNMSINSGGKRSVGILILVLLATFLAMPVPAQAVIDYNQPLPANLMVQTLDGEDVPLASTVEGGKTIIVFFNTVCRVCLQEMKWLLDTYPDLNKVFVSIDMGGGEVVKGWQKKISSTINLEGETVLIDPEFKVPKQFGFSATPSSILVDDQGMYVKGLNGFDDYSMDFIKNFMNPKPKAPAAAEKK